MTNSSALPPSAVAASFKQLLAEEGVTETYGVEVLRLVRVVNNAYDSLLNYASGQGALTPPRWHLLLRIWLEEQLGMPAANPTHLSRVQQVSKNTISDHLRALEEAGLIERELDQADRRQFKIWLTDAGRDAVRRTTPNHVRHLNALVAALDRDEIEQLKNLLERLHRALRSQAQENSCHS